MLGNSSSALSFTGGNRDGPLKMTSALKSPTGPSATVVDVVDQEPQKATAIVAPNKTAPKQAVPKMTLSDLMDRTLTRSV